MAFSGPQYARKMPFSFYFRERKYEMTVEMLKGKIHRATVIQAELDYVGSITVDEENRISRITSYEKHGLLRDMK